MLEKYRESLKPLNTLKFLGRVTKVVGLTIESAGPQVKMGEVCYIYPVNSDVPITSEVVGFHDEGVLLMPLGDMTGVGPGSRVLGTGRHFEVEVGYHMLGRVLDGIGQPIDGKGKLQSGKPWSIHNDPPNPLFRQRIDKPLTLGVRAIDSMLTIGQGQRVGIFAGSGVGKSTLLGMIARNTSADINVIALIGERGREVREFIENDLGPEGLARSILVVATSEKPALVRVTGALMATAIAEFFRSEGKSVMLMMDSLTRFSMAQREIGLATGEPPVTRGYTPSVFAMLPKMLERAGNNEVGSITALYTVLVDGDDMNEPITDTVRGILDGHIVLARKLANNGHYPAIDVLQSISRVMPNIVDESHLKQAMILKELMAVYNASEDLISIGAYQRGSNPKLDIAINKHDKMMSFLQQGMYEKTDFLSAVEALTTVAK
jgi:flagellum-specific ATP synthase